MEPRVKNTAAAAGVARVVHLRAPLAAPGGKRPKKKVDAAGPEAGDPREMLPDLDDQVRVVPVPAALVAAAALVAVDQAIAGHLRARVAPPEEAAPLKATARAKAT